jgi:hypothetical protein
MRKKGGRNVQRTLDAVPESSIKQSDFGRENDVYWWQSCPPLMQPTLKPNPV